MDRRLTELKEMALLKAVTRLLRWNKNGLVTWCHIAENGKAEHNTMEDFEKVLEALSDDDFQGNFTIRINSGSAMVGWSINAQNEKIE